MHEPTVVAQSEHSDSSLRIPSRADRRIFVAGCHALPSLRCADRPVRCAMDGEACRTGL